MRKNRSGFGPRLVSGALTLGAAFICSSLASSVHAGDESGAQTKQEVSLEEVVVTARRREENLQTVPVSVTVLNPTELKQLDITSLSELQYYVPSLNIQAQANDYNYPPISIRGQGTYAPGATPAVLTYLNEVPLAGTINAGDLTGARYYDLENVQVLKGPQGTLFGRNTTGGALLLQSKRPTDQFEGYVEGTVGDYHNGDLDFALNIPVVDKTVLLRIAGQRLSRQGFATVLSTPDHPDGQDMGNRDVWSGRVTLTVKPMDSVENDLIYERHTQHTNGFPLPLIAVNPLGPAALVFPQLPALLAQQQALGTNTLIPIDTEPSTSLHIWSVTDLFRFDFTPNFRFRNIASYSDTQFLFFQDIDATDLPIFNFPAPVSTPAVTRQITEEPQLQGTSLGGKMTWVIGGFYLDQSQPDFSQNTSVVFGGPTISRVLPGQISKALYAQDTYALLQDLRLTTGFRYTWDERALSNQDTNGVVTKLPDAHFSKPSWTISLEYQARPTTLLYLASRHGYRSGGFNPVAPEASLLTFDPETLTDVEMGVKSDWSLGSAKLRTNFDVYYDWYDSIQLTQLFVLPAGGYAETSNAGTARIYGAEWDAQLHLVGGVSLWTAGSYFHEHFVSLAEGVNPAVAYYYPKYVPEWQVDAGVRYDLSLGPKVGEVSASVNWAWLSTVSTSLDLVPEPYDTVPAYGIFNFNADWNHIAGGPVDASIFVTNLTDKHYLSGTLSLYNENVGLGYTLGTYGLPRMYGLRLRYRF